MSFKKIVNIEKPLCLTVNFESDIKGFTVLNKDGKIFYLRIFKNPTTCASFNINEKGVYVIVSDSAINGLRTDSIKRFIPIKLPRSDWNFQGKTTHEISSKSNSPASMLPSKRHMTIHPKMNGYPVCVQNFIYAHEKGHQLYASELNADMYAINYVMSNGGNLFPCLYTLETILSRSPLKMLRLESMIKKIKQSNLYGQRKR